MRPRRLALLAIPLALAACAVPAPSVLSVPPRAGNTSGLLIRLDMGYAPMGLGRHSADYLADGTVIRWANHGAACEPGRPCGALEQNTLTASGLTALRALLARDADLLAEPMTVKPQSAPGTHPLGHGDTTDTFILERPDGTRFAVQAPSTTSDDASTWVPDRAITRLNTLADAMLDPATLAGAGGLANPAWAAYQPSATGVVVRLTAAVKPVPFDGPFGPDVQKTGWSFGGAPGAFGAAYTPNLAKDPYFSLATATFRCAFLSSGDAMKAIASLPSAGSSLAPGMMAAGDTWGSGGLRWGDDVDFGMRAVALLPEDVAGSCADAFSY